MALWMSSGRHSRGGRSGRFLNSLIAYMHTRNAALRVESAAGGHVPLSEEDLHLLGIEHTPAYAAVARD